MSTPTIAPATRLTTGRCEATWRRGDGPTIIVDPGVNDLEARLEAVQAECKVGDAGQVTVSHRLKVRFAEGTAIRIYSGLIERPWSAPDDTELGDVLAAVRAAAIERATDDPALAAELADVDVTAYMPV